MKFVIIIPARMGSKRLRGKILKKINNHPLLWILIKRLKKVKSIKKIVVSTTKNKVDDKIIQFCKKNKISYYRGSTNNVAERVCETASKFNADAFIRINGDSPFIDYRIIDKLINIFKKKKPDLMTNIFPRSFPIGQSVEIVDQKTLSANLNKLTNKSHKEHITKYFYKNSKKFKIENFKNSENYSNKKLAIDTKKDFERFKNMKIRNEKLLNIDMISLLKLAYEKI